MNSAFDLSVQPVESWSKTGAAAFCRVKEDWGRFSNMASGQQLVCDQGRLWTSSEALYQASRFPHLPEVQEAIRRAPNGFIAKKVAYEHVAQSRPDWQEVKHAAMAFALTTRLQDQGFLTLLANSGDLDIVEISMRDPHWGAQPRGEALVGRNMLGRLLMQLRAGARWTERP